MPITNQTKVSSSVANSSKVNIGETWSSITTTWATETRQWQQFASLLINTSRNSSSMTNTSKPA